MWNSNNAIQCDLTKNNVIISVLLLFTHILTVLYPGSNQYYGKIWKNENDHPM